MVGGVQSVTLLGGGRRADVKEHSVRYAHLRVHYKCYTHLRGAPVAPCPPARTDF